MSTAKEATAKAKPSDPKGASASAKSPDKQKEKQPEKGESSNASEEDKQKEEKKKYVPTFNPEGNLVIFSPYKYFSRK